MVSYKSSQAPISITKQGKRSCRKAKAERWSDDEGDSEDDGADFEAETLTKPRARRQSSRSFQIPHSHTHTLHIWQI